MAFEIAPHNLLKKKDNRKSEIEFEGHNVCGVMRCFFVVIRDP